MSWPGQSLGLRVNPPAYAVGSLLPTGRKGNPLCRTCARSLRATREAPLEPRLQGCGSARSRPAAGPETLAGICGDPEGVRAWSGSESASPRPRTTSPRLSTTQKRLRASMMVSPALHGPTHHLPLPRCAWRHHPAGVRPWRSSGHESPSARRMLGAWPPRPSRAAPALHLATRHTRCGQLQSPVSANASRPLGTATMDI